MQFDSLKIHKQLMVHGMEIGEFASLMALGLHLEVQQLLVRLTPIVLPFAKPLNFYLQHKERTVDGERVIFQAQKRFVAEWLLLNYHSSTSLGINDNSNNVLLNENNADICTSRRKPIKCCTYSMGSYGTNSCWTGSFLICVCVYLIIGLLHCELNFKIVFFPLFIFKFLYTGGQRPHASSPCCKVAH